MEQKNDEPCCSKPKRQQGILHGLLFGAIPHIGCIAFIIGSILGVTFLMQFFKPLLMNRYFFYILVGISLMFAAISSSLYLKRLGLLSKQGVRRKWRYLSWMFGSTIGVNLLLFMLVFPLLANVSVSAAATDTTGNAVLSTSSLSTMQLQVDIPCPGHAPLISNELKTVNGVKEIKFSFPNKFDVSYDSSKTSKQEILSLAVFNEYPAKVVSEEGFAGSSQQPQQQPAAASPSGTCGMASGGGCGCGMMN